MLVTKTEPDNADTGNTGTLDGYKEMAADGWCNLEKFRRRIDPLKPDRPPAPVELAQPTAMEIMKALSPQSDLRYELQIEVRTNGAAMYQPVEKVPEMFSRIVNYRQPNERRSFDLRVSWRFNAATANEYGRHAYADMPPQYQAMESIREKTSIQLAEAFKTNLATRAPLSRNDTSNKAAAIEHAYRQGEIDKGVAMVELMTLQDNQSQDFYGRVIDQLGQPVIGAAVTVEISVSVGRGGTQKTQTDAEGNFQFTGLRGSP